MERLLFEEIDLGKESPRVTDRNGRTLSAFVLSFDGISKQR